MRNEWFGKASSRYDKLRKRTFASQEAAELVHSISFQKLLDKTGADSKNKKRWGFRVELKVKPRVQIRSEGFLRYSTPSV